VKVLLEVHAVRHEQGLGLLRGQLFTGHARAILPPPSVLPYRTRFVGNLVECEEFTAHGI
jgi:hypothetical protein